MTSRKCITCEKWHDTGLEDWEGKRIEDFDKCVDCIVKFSFRPVTEQIALLDHDSMTHVLEDAIKRIKDEK